MEVIQINDIKGIGGRSVNSVLWQVTDIGSEKLAIILPGYLYPAEGPITFYLKLLFLKYKYDVLSIDYRYGENSVFQSLDGHNKEKYLCEDWDQIFHHIKAKYQHKSAVFIGKSLGTTAMYHIINNNINDKFVRSSIYLWLTPASKNEEIIDLCFQEKFRSFYIIGTKDPYYNDKLLERKKIDTFEFLVLENAGHILENEENLEESIENLKDAILWIEENMKRNKWGL